MENDTIKSPKIKEKIAPKNKKTSLNKALQKKSRQRKKHLGSPLSNILWTILRIDKGGTRTNGLKDKEINDFAKVLTSESSIKQIVCQEKKEMD